MASRMENLRVWLAMNVFSPLQGATLPDVWRELRGNRFAVDFRYCPRLGCILLFCQFNTFFAWWAKRKFASVLANTTVPPPVFILGHWRGGTTLLQQYFAHDDRFGFPTFYEVVFPRGFLLTEDRNSARYSWYLPSTRIFDNMSYGFSAPAEDEFGLAVLTGMSPYLSWSFPRRCQHYDRYLTFRDVPQTEIDHWKSTFKEYAKRLTARHQKPLVLKSPTHTCRIKLLLEIFPDARFVHIHRDPYVIYPSTKRMLETFMRSAQLQTFDPAMLEERILRQYREMYDQFFAERHLIPPGRFHEVGFEELEHHPLAKMEEIYQALGLPDFSVARPKLEAYLATVKDYRKNQYPDLSAPLRGRIRQDWARAFDEWKYPSGA